MTGERQTILRTDHLKAFYVLEMYRTQKVVQAVNDLDMKIYENEIYGIAGESGCGKTTLLKTLYNDIVPPLRLISGKVYYRINGGKEIDATTLKPEEKRKLRLEYISNIPQGSMSVFNPVLKIKETYKDFITSHVRGPSREEILERAQKQILEFGLPKNILNVYPHQLSGGMRQRVTIALAALMKPRIMIGDAKLFISPKTVENHRANIFKKLNLHNKIDLLRYATKLGLIDLTITFFTK